MYPGGKPFNLKNFSFRWPRTPQWTQVGLYFLKFFDMAWTTQEIGDSVGGNVVVTSLCFSSWETNAKTMFIEGKWPIRKIWPQTWLKDLLSPIKKWEYVHFEDD